MLGFSAIAEVAISALPDDASNSIFIAASAGAEVSVTFTSPLAAVVARTDVRLVYTAEITVRTLV